MARPSQAVKVLILLIGKNTLVLGIQDSDLKENEIRVLGEPRGLHVSVPGSLLVLESQ